jgi:hypothetical protein
VLGCARNPAPMPLPRQFPPNAVASPETAARPVAKDLPKPVEAPTERERYWEWIALADLMTVPLTITWFKRSSVLWGVPTVVASPSVHAIHGNHGIAAASFGMRAALYGLTYVSMRSGECEGEWVCVPTRSLLFLDLAVVLTTTFDIYFAYTDQPIAKWKKLPVIPSVVSNGRDALFTFSWTL